MKFDRLLHRADRLGFDAPGHRPSRPGRPRRRRCATSCAGAPTRPRTSPTCSPCWARTRWPAWSSPSGELTKDEVRANARRLGLRTAGKPDSQDVCFIGSAEGRAGFLSGRLDAARRRGGRRRGPPGRLGRRGRARHGGPAARAWATAATARGATSRRRRGGAPGHRRQRGTRCCARRSCCAGPSLTWVDRPLAAGARAVAQVSAHGRPVPCTVVAQPDDDGTGGPLRRPAAPGGTGPDRGALRRARPRRRRGRRHRRLTVAKQADAPVPAEGGGAGPRSCAR